VEIDLLSLDEGLLQMFLLVDLLDLSNLPRVLLLRPRIQDVEHPRLHHRLGLSVSHLKSGCPAVLS